jgi:hypothetical protein
MCQICGFLPVLKPVVVRLEPRYLVGAATLNAEVFPGLRA